MFLPHNHDLILGRLTEIFRRYSINFDQQYGDGAGSTNYPLIEGKSMKFWNVFPRSGNNFDLVLLDANEFLRPYGLHLAPHNFVKTYRKLVHTYDQPGNYTGMKYVDFPSPTFSLLVKPLPAGYSA